MPIPVSIKESNPIFPWGAQDRFQAHFIVKKDAGVNDIQYIAKTKLTTRGHFASKKVVKVQWDGGDYKTWLDEFVLSCE